MNFTDMGLEARFTTQEVKVNDAITLTVRNCLPIDAKTEFIRYVVESAVDNRTGCFSPLSVEVYFALALCRWYGGVEFDSLTDAGKAYDILDTNGVIEKISQAIDPDELKYIRQLTEETVADIARYNNSAAGIIQMMSSDSKGLEDELNKLIGEVKSGEGLEMLKEIQGLVKVD